MIDEPGIECPHCGESLRLESYVAANVRSYQDDAIARAECCGKAVHVAPIFKYRVTAYETDRERDDWGKEFVK